MLPSIIQENKCISLQVLVKMFKSALKKNRLQSKSITCTNISQIVIFNGLEIDFEWKIEPTKRLGSAETINLLK